MAWTDPATDKQIQAISDMIGLRIHPKEREARIRWLKEPEHRPTRRLASAEIKRMANYLDIHGHRHSYSGSVKREFVTSAVWEGYDRYIYQEGGK